MSWWVELQYGDEMRAFDIAASSPSEAASTALLLVDDNRNWYITVYEIVGYEVRKVTGFYAKDLEGPGDPFYRG